MGNKRNTGTLDLGYPIVGNVPLNILNFQLGDILDLVGLQAEVAADNNETNNPNYRYSYAVTASARPTPTAPPAAPV